MSQYVLQGHGHTLEWMPPVAAILVEDFAHTDLLSRIGNIQLLEIPSAARGSVEVFAKAEFLNPGGR